MKAQTQKGDGDMLKLKLTLRLLLPRGAKRGGKQASHKSTVTGTKL